MVDGSPLKLLCAAHIVGFAPNHSPSHSACQSVVWKILIDVGIYLSSTPSHSQSLCFYSLLGPSNLSSCSHSFLLPSPFTLLHKLLLLLTSMAPKNASNTAPRGSILPARLSPSGLLGEWMLQRFAQIPNTLMGSFGGWRLI